MISFKPIQGTGIIKVVIKMHLASILTNKQSPQ